MKGNIFFLGIVIILSYSCKDPELIPIYNEEEQFVIDNELLVDYMKTHTITGFEIADKKEGDTSIYDKLGTKLEKLESGVYYYEVEGNGNLKPILNDTIKSYVSVYYEGKLLNGNSFDKNFPDEKGIDTVYSSNFLINNLVDGFKEGVSKMKTGGYDTISNKFINPGKAFIFIPSKLGYGLTEREEIPYNSPLIFKVQLESVANGS